MCQFLELALPFIKYLKAIFVVMQSSSSTVHELFLEYGFNSLTCMGYLAPKSEMYYLYSNEIFLYSMHVPYVTSIE